MNPLMQIAEVSLKVCFVGRPRQSINPRGGVAFFPSARHENVRVRATDKEREKVAHHPVIPKLVVRAVRPLLEELDSKSFQLKRLVFIP
jgi:hypothetical protein